MHPYNNSFKAQEYSHQDKIKNNGTSPIKSTIVML